MKHYIWLGLFWGMLTQGAVFTEQDVREKQAQSVVRQKLFDKQDRFELGVHAGTIPYDSILTHVLGGAKIAWYPWDQFGWEIVRADFASPSTTTYAQNLVKDKGLSNLQAAKLKWIATSNIIYSPFYGKFKFFGENTLHFDLFLLTGLGAAQTETIKLSSTGAGVAANETVVKSATQLVWNVGVGFKFFLSQGLGLYVDLRDYVVFAETYGRVSGQQNYSVAVGLHYFLPSF